MGEELTGHIEERLNMVESRNRGLGQVLRENEWFFEVYDDGGLVVDCITSRFEFSDPEEYQLFGDDLYDSMVEVSGMPVLSDTRNFGYMKPYEGNC